jgi:cell shape-determining protein MreC
MPVIKTEVEGIVRDVSNGALLNKDNVRLEAYKKIKKKNQEMEDLKTKVNSFENELTDIKSLLHKVLEKIS